MSSADTSTCAEVFIACAQAIKNAVLVERVSATDKEFHFQNWVERRIEDAGFDHDSAGRNSYPDFTLVRHPDGYEVKGLKFPGREANYDSNSRVPTGLHNGRTIFYVFGRYPAEVTETKYPVVDLVLCHGDFLNANHDYVHENKNFRGFGSYGDLLVRDRKMYVAPTPFALAEGTTGKATLIAPDELIEDERVERVGTLCRIEADQLVTAYTFDLEENSLTPQYAPNPSAGEIHEFGAYQLKGPSTGEVKLKDVDEVTEGLGGGSDEVD